YESMRDAVKKLDPSPDILLNDAVTIPGIKIKQVPIIKGDAKSASIAAASILAKVSRDRYMLKLAEEYPGYGFEQHKGYGTKLHCDKLKELGASAVHRKSFLKKILADDNNG
ncbi:MAG: ribonuclease HII, partial [Ruminococcus sp.]|nr:ribonuclease HII [Ruminococcus sp.]